MEKIVCFHNPDEENGFLSNWAPSRFAVRGVDYTSLEQYMMHRKALAFGDREIAARVLATDDPAAIKALGRQVAGYDDGYWGGIRQVVVYEGLKAKFSQDPRLRERLEDTGDAILAECSKEDLIWGNGVSMTDPARFERTLWRGRNLMGYTLMVVRAALW